jgi:hypothetical protein
MSTNTIVSTDRKCLLRELLALGELSTMPAIHTSRELSREVRRERRELLNKLRDLPLAG